MPPPPPPRNENSVADARVQMFTGSQPTDPNVYDLMSKDEQLQSVKEMGMVFTYLNSQTVWDGFCGSYEAIYDLLGDFDTW